MKRKKKQPAKNKSNISLYPIRIIMHIVMISMRIARILSLNSKVQRNVRKDRRVKQLINAIKAEKEAYNEG
jgi:hypothetical protein